MARLVLDAPGPRPTAIFCANNFIAFGVIRALQEERGLHVPDDMERGRVRRPAADGSPTPFLNLRCPAPPTTSALRADLLGHISGEHSPSGESVVLPFELI